MTGILFYCFLLYVLIKLYMLKFNQNKNMKKHCFLLFALTLFSLIFAQEKILRVGLMPFKGEGYSIEELKTMTARFQDEVFKANKFQLMEQEKMQAIMNEQGLGQGGCTEAACFVEIGKAVGVEQMLMGSVSKIGKITSITIKIIDVQTGRIIKSTVMDTKDKYETILKKHLSRLAEKIAGKESLGKSIYAFDPAQKREPIAVLEISGNGIEKAETKGLSDRLRAELFNTGRFDVMEREQMEDILKEQGFQQSGIAQFILFATLTCDYIYYSCGKQVFNI